MMATTNRKTTIGAAIAIAMVKRILWYSVGFFLASSLRYMVIDDERWFSRLALVLILSGLLLLRRQEC